MEARLIEQGTTEQKRSWKWDMLVKMATVDNCMRWIELRSWTLAHSLLWSNFSVILSFFSLSLVTLICAAVLLLRWLTDTFLHLAHMLSHFSISSYIYYRLTTPLASSLVPAKYPLFSTSSMTVCSILQHMTCSTYIPPQPVFFLILVLCNYSIKLASTTYSLCPCPFAFEISPLRLLWGCCVSLWVPPSE